MSSSVYFKRKQNTLSEGGESPGLHAQILFLYSLGEQQDLLAFAAQAGWLLCWCRTESPRLQDETCSAPRVLALCKVTYHCLRGRWQEGNGSSWRQKTRPVFFPPNRYVALLKSARLHECRWIESGSGAINSEVRVSLWCNTATDVECLLSFFFFFSFCTCFQFLRQPDTSPSLHPILFYFSFACVSALAASSLIVLRLPRL